ncbi:MAG: hypothetical protein KKI02_08445 [Planctomycetes bacterium]|nr:hypothetical protein [Planctomycetota bacterium]
MEFLLLFLALSGLVLQAGPAHVILFLAHAAAAVPIAWRMLRKQPLAAMFIAIYLLMFFPNPIAVMLGWIPAGHNERPSILYPCNVMLLVGLDLFIFGARRLRFKRLDIDRMPRLRLNNFPVDVCITICMAFCATSALILVSAITAMGVNPFTIGKTFVTAGYATEQTLYYRLANYSFLTLPLAVFLIGLKRPRLHLPYLVPILFLLQFHFMVFRVRSSFVAVLVAYMTATLVRSFLVTVGPRSPRGRLAPQLRLLLLAAAPTLVFFVVAFKYVRHSYMINDYRITANRVRELAAATFAGGDLGFAYQVRRALDLFPDDHPYLKGQSYYRLLFVPIPRSVWPGKPENTQRIFARVHDPRLRRRGTTIPAGIVGDLYINFGPLGVLGMIVWGALFALERYRRLSHLFVLAASGWWLVHIVRGSVTVPLLFLAVMWVFSVVFEKIIRPTPLPPPVVPAMTGPGGPFVSPKPAPGTVAGHPATHLR